MTTVYFDLDDTLCKYSEAHTNLSVAWKMTYPQSHRNFYDSMKSIEEALSLFNALKSLGVDCRIATAMSIHNPETYQGKYRFIHKHLGFDVLNDLIYINDKSLLKGDFLIDDGDQHGQPEFEGTWIQVTPETNWVKVFYMIWEKHKCKS